MGISRDPNRRSIRLKGFDYFSPGGYFVTICTTNKEHVLGSIKSEKVIFSPAGKIVSAYWEENSDHYLNVDLDQWIIMPNHLYGIIIIHEPCRGEAFP